MFLIGACRSRRKCRLDTPNMARVTNPAPAGPYTWHHHQDGTRSPRVFARVSSPDTRISIEQVKTASTTFIHSGSPA